MKTESFRSHLSVCVCVCVCVCVLKLGVLFISTLCPRKIPTIPWEAVITLLLLSVVRSSNALPVLTDLCRVTTRLVLAPVSLKSCRFEAN